MNGFRTLVLQDLPHVLPSKGLQLSSSHLHTATSTRRFWSFFEFSPKEVCRDSKKCPKEIVSTTLISSNEFEDISKAQVTLPQAGTIASSMAMNPKVQACQFDLKTTPISLKIPRPLKQDNLISLLDGNPVPRTMKWKLKGYKTLRCEQAGDFAFVPGGNSYDFDFLSRDDHGELITITESSNELSDSVKSEKTADGGKDHVEAAKINIEGERDTLFLTARAIENKGDIQGVKKNVTSVTESVKAKDLTETKNVSLNDLNVDVSKSVTGPDHGASLAPQKKDIKYLPISKSELSAGQTRYQSQPSAQYCSRPPARIPKPSPPVLRSEELTTSPKKHVTSTEPHELNPAPETSGSSPAEAEQNVTSEWSTMEPEPNSMITRESNASEQQASNKMAQESVKQVQEPMESVQEEEMQKKVADTHDSRITFENENQKPQVQSPTYFAPRSWTQSKYPTRQPSRSDDNSSQSTYESIIGIPPRETTLKISSQQDGKQATSPCAATQARLQQNHSGNVSSKQQMGSFGSSMTGGSGGGSRKPPSSFPPFTTQRMSSSNSSCLLRKLPPREAGNTPRRADNAKNASNISTSSVNPAPKRCRDRDDRRSSGSREKCSRRRSCEREERRPKCQKETKSKKTCKRYCCPALQRSTDCEYGKFQCPKKEKERSSCTTRRREDKKQTEDPTCLPNEPEDSYGASCKRDRGNDRSMCTDPSRRKTDCNRERQCNRERRDRSCSRDAQGSRNKDGSCQRQERRDCSQRDEGRVICTKPRKRESCNRRRCDDRNCGKRSAKSTGRRHYTQSAYVKRSTSFRNAKRFSSVPALGFSLIGMRIERDESNQTLGASSRSRFYGKCSKGPSTCKSSESVKKSKNCKKGPPKCLNREASDKKCQTPGKTESKCRTSCDKTKPEKEDTDRARSKSDDYCAERKQQLCKDKKKESASGEESAKERTDREWKEMQECKKDIRRKGKDKKKEGEKKAMPSGLERVVSPCKLKQLKKSKKDKCSATKLGMSSVAAPLCYLSNSSDSSGLMNRETKLFVAPNPSEYTLKTHYYDDYDMRETYSNPWRDFWNFTGDDDLGNEAELPLPITVENEENEPNDNSYSTNNWFLSWFDHSHL